MSWGDLAKIADAPWWIWVGFAVFFSPVWIIFLLIFLARRLVGWWKKRDIL